MWLSDWNEIGAIVTRPRILDRADTPVDSFQLGNGPSKQIGITRAANRCFGSMSAAIHSP
jgi:hypothetical protein